MMKGSSIESLIAVAAFFVCACSTAEVRKDPPPSRRSDRTLSILENLTRRPPRPPAPTPPSPTSRPEKRQSLTPTEIRTGMRLAASGVMDCYDRHRLAGRYAVTLKISPAGQPTAVRPALSGGFSLGVKLNPHEPTARCVCDAVRKSARFPSFAGPPITITYPFVFAADRPAFPSR